MSVHVQVMLTGEMKESREGRVDLKGVSGKGLKVVVDFAYTGGWLLYDKSISVVFGNNTLK